ncbi:MAG: radical SAM protein, partial [Oribacterium sp.]|nr:radical SAM protein [Oribacterium sp.]
MAETLAYGKSEESPEINKPFSHIYVEEKVFLDEEYREKAEEIISHFPEAVVVRIGHYKDVFNRHRQNYVRQHESQALILAVKPGALVYPGAKVCQSMGNKHFYYTSCMMNCLFDCEYCYLKGMYPSGNMVIFLNLRDIFSEVEALLKEHPVYLCVSYDSDLMAIEKLTGYVSEWIGFTNRYPELTIEIRTKAGNIDFEAISFVSPRNIFAFTLSPDYVVKHYEHKTGSLEGRIRSVKKALELGFTVRLCFDPMIFCPDWRDEYGKMMDKVFAEVPV